MQLHHLSKSKSGFHYVGVEGVELDSRPDVEKVLSRLGKVSVREDVPLQIVDARNVCGAKQVYHAATLALTAHQEGNARAKRIELEILLYLSGKRQIGEAIQCMGISEQTREVGLIALGGSEKVMRGALQDAVALINGRADDVVLELTDSKRIRLQDIYGVSNEELAIVARNGNWKEGLLKCVLERAAMLDGLKK